MSTSVETPKGQAAEAEPPPPPGKSRFRWVIVVLVVAGLIGGFFYWQHASKREETDDAQIEGHLHAISSRVGGTVVKVHVNDNQYVEAGTVLVELDPADYEVAVARAQADLAEAEATLAASRIAVPIAATTSTSGISGTQAGVAEARVGVSTAENQVSVLQARLHSGQAMVQEAKANADKAARDLERMKQLIAKEEISRQQYDAAVATAAATQAQLDSAEAQLREVEQGIQVSRSQLEQARVRVKRAEADALGAQTGPRHVVASQARARSAEAKVEQMRALLEQAKLNLGYTVVKAPVNGIVSQKTVESGQMVQAGQPLLSVVPMEDIWVVANFKENQLAHMRPGQKVTIEVDAYGGREYEGHVDSIAAATGSRFSLLPPENATGNYVKVVQRVPVKIVFEKGQDKEHLLRPGMSVVPTVLVK